MTEDRVIAVLRARFMQLISTNSEAPRFAYAAGIISAMLPRNEVVVLKAFVLLLGGKVDDVEAGS